jgi:hypothetical protein
MLEARLGFHRKRQVPKGGLGGLDIGSLLQGLLGQPRRNSTAPASTVAEVQDQEPKDWPGAKRRKVRYGPYRIPPISVSRQYTSYDRSLTIIVGEKYRIRNSEHPGNGQHVQNWGKKAL